MIHAARYSDFDERSKSLSSRGYRLVDLETFVLSGQRHWAGLFLDGTDAYAMRAGMPSEQLLATRKLLADQGLKLIDLEPYTANGRLHFAGVWRAGEDGPLHVNLNTGDFVTRRAKRARQGYRLVDIETYQHQGQQRWAGIWEYRPGREILSINRPFCNRRHVTPPGNTTGIVRRHNEWRERGFELMDWELD